MGTVSHDDVSERLKSLGYIVDDSDLWVIEFLAGKVIDEIKNECNAVDIPDGLKHVAIDMACGEFLKMKKGTGRLEGFDVEAAVKQISEGDTSVTYAVTDNSITLDSFIDALINGGKRQFTTHRKIRW